MNLTYLSPKLAVSPQIRPTDIARLAAAGFRGIINNRPDREEPGQPRSDEIEAEARQHGLAYRHLPVVPGQATEADIAAFAAAVAGADGPVMAFCRTGNRSAGLWQMAQQRG
jgi:sulfide:quinone oxidoreductase